MGTESVLNDGLTLYRSRNLHVFRRQPSPPAAAALVICFQYLLEEPSLDHAGFAQEFFAKRELDAVFVNCATNAWYQYHDLPEMLECLRQAAVSKQRVVTYGASMGGYAAVRFASAIGAHASIAVAPQYSPRRSVVPVEYRYEALLKETNFLHEKDCRASSSVRNFVIYDPFVAVDRAHVALYREEIALERIAICQGGHTPTVLLSACGLLSWLIAQLIDGSFDAQQLRRALRSRRRGYAEHWREITQQIAACDREEGSRYADTPKV